MSRVANVPGGTELSERRRANGADKPFDIRMWCLGNEMDGPWQLGHKSAEDYGMPAASAASCRCPRGSCSGAQPASVEAQTLHDDDLFAANTLYDQNRVTPHANGSAMYDAESGVVRVSLPPVSSGR